jgi:hypothetical protein
LVSAEFSAPAGEIKFGIRKIPILKGCQPELDESDTPEFGRHGGRPYLISMQFHISAAITLAASVQSDRRRNFTKSSSIFRLKLMPGGSGFCLHPAVF